MPFVFAFVVPPVLCLLGEVYKSFGFLGVLISLAMIVFFLWLIAFLEITRKSRQSIYMWA